MPRALISTANSYFVWNFPKQLLSIEDNKQAKYGTPWSWFVKYDTLYYFDGEEQEHEIQGQLSEADHKFHENIDIDEDGSAWGLDSSDEEED
jgi:hypothetical protein